MKLRIVLCLLTLSLVLLAGCAESREYNSYQDEIASWSYPKRVGIQFKDWFLDFGDIFSIEVGGGECIGVNVQATELGQVGVLFGDVMKFGWRDRSLGFYTEDRGEGGATWFYYRDVAMTPLVGTPSLFNEYYRDRLYQGFPIRDNKEWHWMDVGGEVAVIFFDASAHVSPKQALDFAFNTVALPFELILDPIFTLAGARYPEVDYCDDDTKAMLRRKYGVELIDQPRGLEPMEYINDRFEVPY